MPFFKAAYLKTIVHVFFAFAYTTSENLSASPPKSRHGPRPHPLLRRRRSHRRWTHHRLPPRRTRRRLHRVCLMQAPAPAVRADLPPRPVLPGDDGAWVRGSPPPPRRAQTGPLRPVGAGERPPCLGRQPHTPRLSPPRRPRHGSRGWGRQAPGRHPRRQARARPPPQPAPPPPR